MDTYHRHRPLVTSDWLLLIMGLTILFHLAGCGTAFSGHVRLTAEIAAGMRAVAAMEPDEKTRNPDYLAGQFLTPAFWFYGPFSKDFKRSKQYINFYRISGYYTVNACTRHIDAIVQALAQQNLKQVVNIGAGLDSRAYRFHKEMPDVRFFEIEQPAGLAHKKSMVKHVLGKLPASVVYVPLDYQKQSIDGALEKAGYDENLRTLFIWEGVTPYLDKQTIDSTLAFIARHSAPGSEVVFDYILAEIARGDYANYPRARFHAVRRKTTGEPWKFGIPEDRAEAFISRRGFQLISDYGPIELAQHYLIQSDGRLMGQPSGYIRIIRARVAQ